MSGKAAIFLCDLTGNMANPWAEAGYQCWCVDIQHSIRRERVEGNIHFVWGDRANLRSATPMGFARAVFEANAPEYRGAAA